MLKVITYHQYHVEFLIRQYIHSNAVIRKKFELMTGCSFSSSFLLLRFIMKSSIKYFRANNIYFLCYYFRNMIIPLLLFLISFEVTAEVQSEYNDFSLTRGYLEWIVLISSQLNVTHLSDSSVIFLHYLWT